MYCFYFSKTLNIITSYFLKYAPISARILVNVRGA